MNEHGFVKKVRKKLRETKKLRRIWKINDNFQGGIPDAYYLASNDLWIEYKYLPRLPKRGSTVIVPEVSELQYGWLEDLQAGGNSAWIVVGHPGKVWMTDDLELCKQGIPCSTFVDQSIMVSDLVEQILHTCL